MFQLLIMTASWPVISNYFQAFYLQISKIYSKQFLQDKKKQKKEKLYSFLGKHSNLDLLMRIFFTTLCKHPKVCHSPNLCNLINAKNCTVLSTIYCFKFGIFYILGLFKDNSQALRKKQSDKIPYKYIVLIRFFFYSFP